jgi:lipopolysaccharide transport system permease protein
MKTSQHEQIRIYTPDSALKRPGILIGEMWKDLRQSRELARRLAIRDISAMYRQSFLGILWAFILPLANTLIWIFLRKSGVVSMGDTKIPYTIYVFAGAMLWAIFIESIQAPLQKTVESKAMLSKINFPREAIILSAIYQSFFNTGIKILLLIIGLLGMGYYDMNWNLLLFPLAVVSLIMVGTSVGLMLTPLGMLYTDISKGLPLFLQFFMFLTPVVYPLPKSGWVADFISYNPVTPLIMTARDWLTGQPADFLSGFIMVNSMSFLLLMVVWLVYRAAMPILIERMSA